MVKGSGLQFSPRPGFNFLRGKLKAGWLLPRYQDLGSNSAVGQGRKLSSSFLGPLPENLVEVGPRKGSLDQSLCLADRRPLS